MRWIRSVGACGVAALALVEMASAQTNDHLYRSWRWSPSVVAPRAAGLGGAYVAVADDVASTWSNPAGIATLQKTEIGASGLFMRPGGLAHGDRLESTTGLGYIGGAGRLGKNLALGGYLVRPSAGRLALDPSFVFPDGSLDTGTLDASIIEGGGVLAYRFGDRVIGGFRVSGSHLTLEGLGERRSGGRFVASGHAGGSTRITGSLGVLLFVSDAMRVGALVTPGASYTVERTANNEAGGLDAGSEYELRAPGLLAVGASWRSKSFLLTGQVDYVRYSEVEAFVRPGSATGGAYAIESAIEPRVGVEYSHLLGSMSLQLRAGLHSQAPGALAYSGPDPAEAAAFSGSSRRLRTAAGLSLVKREASLDLGVTFGGRTEVLAGGRLRF